MICFLSCPDWPVFSDLDNMAPRDHDHLDNHRVGWRRPKGAGLGGMDFLPVRTKAESSDPEAVSLGRPQALPVGTEECRSLPASWPGRLCPLRQAGSTTVFGDG